MVSIRTTSALLFSVALLFAQRGFQAALTAGLLIGSTACDRSPAPDSQIAAHQQLRVHLSRQKEIRDAFVHEIQSAQTDEQRAKIRDEFSKKWLASLDELLLLAQAQASSEAARDAAILIVTRSDSDFDRHIAAAELLSRHHYDSQAMSAALKSLDGLAPVYEVLLRKVAAHSRSAECRACALFELAKVLQTKAEYKQAMEATPELSATRTANFKKRTAIGSEILHSVQTLDVAAARTEAVSIYETLARDYSGIEYRGSSLGSLAKERIAAFNSQQDEIGEAVRNISGIDLEGKPLELKRFDGQVIVIVFWASWCAACLDHLPEENRLVQHFRGEPFALLGVNGDTDIEAARKVVSKYNVEFPSWWDGSQRSITSDWNVTYWPTLYVIDRSGVIRYKNIYGKALESAIKTLLQEQTVEQLPNVHMPSSEAL